MRLLFIAPEVCAPWTEGRKNLVRDLVEISAANHQIELLTTQIADKSELPRTDVTAKHLPHPAIGLVWMERQLESALRRSKPDAIFHFPFGSFDGLRGLANRRVVRAIARACEKAGVPCVTALYSLDGDVTRSQAFFDTIPGVTVAGAGGVWKGPTIEYGLSTKGWPDASARAFDSRSILYLAGMWQPTDERFDFVLKRRGLEVLLQAGTELEAAGTQLTVAVPIFESAAFVKKLRHHPSNNWSPEKLRVVGQTADMPGLLMDHSILAFPYQHEIAIFRPTSVMEAMTVGTVPVLSDLPFLRESLGDATAALWFDHNSPSDLAAVVVDALSDAVELKRRSQEAIVYAASRWSIEATLKSLIEVAGGP